MSDGPVPAAEWETIVSNVPLVSVDLVVETDDGVVLGKRENEPAKGEWFVPGGTVRKHEGLRDAVERVATTELGCSVAIERQLGVYEHFYDTSEFDDTDGKHYVPIGYHVTPTDGEEFEPDDQHSSLRTFEPPFEFDLHPYVEAYLDDAGVLD
ncbi:NUDIX hydrolase [Halorientalis sp. IM1011]|uniref:GDP-mannose mannosyl hydrolase n=1 Tax=Halorientalis sp. IM1011 TaxID=1932360 RepID=UPI00097CCE38|nr:NUDIX domain-containing protein [Halorientalis sp. IM1011]AQL43343.1 NUDIX hydrolase [Halorientalis sp. IM1011]